MSQKPKPVTKQDLKAERLLETFPDVDRAGHPHKHELPPEIVAAANARVAEAVARGKRGK